MAFVALDNVAVGDPARAIEFGQRTKDNFDDLNTRVSALEGSTAAAIFDHFVYDNAAFGGSVHQPGDFWKLFEESPGSSSTTVLLQSTEHSARVTINGAAAGDAGVAIRGIIRLTPPQLPRMFLRGKMVDAWTLLTAFDIGMATDRSHAGVGTSPSDGVFLEITASNVRFACRKNGTQTSGTEFTRPSVGSWFTVEIKYTDTDTVECSTDGTLRSTFNGPTDNVPDGFGDIMYSEVSMNHDDVNGVLTRRFDIDHWRYELQSIANLA